MSVVQADKEGQKSDEQADIVHGFHKRSIDDRKEVTIGDAKAAGCGGSARKPTGHAITPGTARRLKISAKRYGDRDKYRWLPAVRVLLEDSRALCKLFVIPANTCIRVMRVFSYLYISDY